MASFRVFLDKNVEIKKIRSNNYFNINCWIQNPW